MRKLTPACNSTVALLAVAISHVAGAAGFNKATEGMVKRQDLEIVDCLLPGQVHVLGNKTFLSARRPTSTTVADCRIRGGEYVAYDRANLKSSLRVWLDAANDGNPDAMTNVGEIFERGLGGTPDYEEAIQWYRRLVDDAAVADKAKARALVDLGMLYEEGNGVDKDPLQALNYYRRASGVPENNLIYTAAKDREVDELRRQIQELITEKDHAIEEKGQQIALMKRQLEDAQRKFSADATTFQRMVQSLESDVDKLKLESARSQQQLTQLPLRAPRDHPAVTNPFPPVGVSGSPSRFGRYFALIIGNQIYDQIESLKTPHLDSENIAAVLREKYGFSVELVEDANDVGILSALNDLNKVLGPNDNLLIYYAGHGKRVDDVAGSTKSGYWLPRNASPPPDDTFWILNEQVTKHIARFQAKRVLVVADSCYGGLLSGDPSQHFLDSPGQISQAYVDLMLPNRSRLLISSGGDAPVLDEGGAGNSVFAKAFLGVLRDNQGILSAPVTFSLVEKRVREGAARNHFTQQPEFKAIKQAGHEFGDFFLVPVAAGKT